MNDIKPNNMMLQVSIRFIAIIVLTFSLYLFFAGHNSPGGGFVGGLMTASGVLLYYLVFDKKDVAKNIPFNFNIFISIGLLFASGTGIISWLAGTPFLTQFFAYVDTPFFGTIELTTALLFDLGVYFCVVGGALSIILEIAEDDK